MLYRSLIIPIVLVVALCVTIADARASDDPRYPTWSGGWARDRSSKGGNWDPDKPRGLGQQAPLTVEYQALYDASLADQEHGGQGVNPGYTCQPHGMPRIMNGNHPLFFAVTPEATYIMRDIANQFRRIYTDGRDWPAHLQHSSNGYSIGKWLDRNEDGRYDTLVIETRGLRNPHSYDSSGLPFHKDNAAVIKEQIYLDRTNPEVMRDEIITIDDALTRPWTVTRSYRHVRDPKWVEYVCAEDNHHLVLGTEDYLVSEDGFIMPTRKGQNPPDLRNFAQPRE
jgi:hypothetical protein